MNRNIPFLILLYFPLSIPTFQVLAVKGLTKMYVVVCY
nr:MAG TPA: hypothetical protein [Caudoviricetes sp.]